MPSYCWQCEQCGTTQGTFQHMSESERAPKCPDCDNPMTRDYPAEGAGRVVDHETDYPEPRRSVAAGIHPRDIAAEKAKHPHHEFCERTGDMIFRSPGHERQCLKDIGLHRK